MPEITSPKISFIALYLTALRFYITGLLLLWSSYQYSNWLIQQLIPLYTWMIKTLDYRLDQVMLNIVIEHQQAFLNLQTRLSQPFIVDTQTITLTVPIVSGGKMPLGYALIPVVVIFTMVIAWPAKHRMTYLYRCLLAVPLMLIILLFDIPIQLLNMAWQGFNALLQLSPTGSLKYMGYWSDFLNGGGLIAVSISVGLVVVGMIDYWQTKK